MIFFSSFLLLFLQDFTYICLTEYLTYINFKKKITINFINIFKIRGLQTHFINKSRKDNQTVLQLFCFKIKKQRKNSVNLVFLRAILLGKLANFVQVVLESSHLKIITNFFSDLNASRFLSLKKKFI